VTVFPQCFRCKHFIETPHLACAAYPSGIPDAILTDEHDHIRPYPGDHGIRFEPRSDAEAEGRAGPEPEAEADRT
jgi:hypothetical protein